MLIEIRELLVEIRDLLIPISDAYRPAHEHRLAVRAILSTDKRKKAWALANGEMTQRDIAKQAGMDQGGTSRFFKELRELGAIGDGPNPQRIVDV
jgi:CRP-like cAMP-binding protein